MDWVRALSECASVMQEAHFCREAGFTTDALRYPRTATELALICAFNGIEREQAPNGWKYFPNEAAKRSWGRVAEAAIRWMPPRQRCVHCDVPLPIKVVCDECLVQ